MVLSLEGSTLRQLQLPGLVSDQASLLMSALPGGQLLQVTPQVVLLLDAPPHHVQLAQWQPPKGAHLLRV